MADDGPRTRQAADADGAAPGLSDSLHALGDDARAGLKAASDAAKALRILVSADVSLARSAFGRTLAFTGVAIAFGASTWLLLMAAMVVWLSRGLGLAWPTSMLLTALASGIVTAAAAWAAMRYFEHTRMQATRRQLARLGIGELASLMPDAGSHASAEAAAGQVAATNAEAPVKKGLGVDVTPP